MTAPAFEDSATAPTRDPISVIRTRAAADAKLFRALARAALVDGLPKAELRSANARSAARHVLDHARRLSALGRTLPAGIRPAEMAD